MQDVQPQAPSLSTSSHPGRPRPATQVGIGREVRPPDTSRALRRVAGRIACRGPGPG
jgi:hypothetical protein